MVEIAEVLKMNPQMTLELQGHVEAREKEGLAAVRAGSVLDFLLAIDVDPARISVTMKGDSAPLITVPQIARMATKEEKEAAHAMNRRVDFRVMSFDWIPEQEVKPNGAR